MMRIEVNRLFGWADISNPARLMTANSGWLKSVFSSMLALWKRSHPEYQ